MVSVFDIGAILQTNAFLVPSWGGIVIRNLPQAQDTHFTLEDLHDVFELFISQTRSLLGVKATTVKHHLSLLVRNFNFSLIWKFQ